MSIEMGPYARGEIGPGLAPYMSVIDEVFDDFGHNMRITHIRDGKHSRGSLHYVGDAVDIIWLPYKDMPPGMAHDIRDQLYLKLNGFPRTAGMVPDYDIVYEGSHFHIEYQPKLDNHEYREQIASYIHGE